MSFIPNLVPKTLLARFMLIIIIPTLIGQVVAVFLFYDRHWYNVSYYTSSIIVKEIDSLLNNYKNENYRNQNLMEDYLSLSYQFQKGGVLGKKQPRINEELQIFKNILDSKIKYKNIVRVTKESKIEVLFQLPVGVMKIIFSSKTLLNPTTYIFVLWLAFLTLLLLSISLIFSKNQIRSILELTEAADSFGRGENKLQLYKPSGAKEIRKAGLAFLKMKERIEKQVAKRMQMLAMISHDLRTPLTRMKLQLELMPKSEETNELKEDIETMRQMINSYLDFARGEKGEEFQTVSMTDWLLEFIKAKWAINNIDFKATKELTKVQIKPYSFERMIANIIDNAIKYATKIKISVYATSSQVIIDIEDNGSGIKDEEKMLVFNAFYRSDKSRHLANSGSVGLGLAITKEIVANHNGTITLEDSEDLGGLLVKISLPKCT